MIVYYVDQKFIDEFNGFIDKMVKDVEIYPVKKGKEKKVQKNKWIPWK